MKTISSFHIRCLTDSPLPATPGPPLPQLVVLPEVQELQVSAETKWQWVNYSAYDAKSTWDLYCALEAKLRAMGVSAHVDPAVVADFANAAGLSGAGGISRFGGGSGRGCRHMVMYYE